MITNDMISNTPPAVQGLHLRELIGNIALGIVFLDTLPRVNIRHTSLRGTHCDAMHWQYSRLHDIFQSKDDPCCTTFILLVTSLYTKQDREEEHFLVKQMHLIHRKVMAQGPSHTSFGR